jgi:serine protease Do
MTKAFGYGLVLLAGSTIAMGSALAAVDPDGGAFFFFSGNGPVIAHGAQGYLGVDVRDVPADQLATLKLKDGRGAEIVLVDHDAPAGKAGLREHDVVLQMNGQAIDGEDQIRKLLHEYPPGKTITLVVSRDGQQITVTAQMANREEVERQAWEQHLTVPDPQPAAADVTGGDFSPSAASSAPGVRGGNSFIGTLLMNPSYTGAMVEIRRRRWRECTRGTWYCRPMRSRWPTPTIGRRRSRTAMGGR